MSNMCASSEEFVMSHDCDNTTISVTVVCVHGFLSMVCLYIVCTMVDGLIMSQGKGTYIFNITVR